MPRVSCKITQQAKSRAWTSAQLLCISQTKPFLLCHTGSLLEDPGISKSQFGPWTTTKKILEITFYVIFCEKHTCVWRSLKYKFIWIAYRISKLHVWQLSQHIYPQFFVVVFPVLKNTRSDCILETKARKVSLTPLWPLPLFIILTNSIQIFLI